MVYEAPTAWARVAENDWYDGGGLGGGVWRFTLYDDWLRGRAYVSSTTALREAHRAAMIEGTSKMRLRLRNVASESACLAALLHASATNRPAVAKLHMHL